FCPLATGGKETRHNENENERAERHGIAQGQSRCRPPGLEFAGRKQRALDVRLPKCLRDGILTIGGNAVGNRRPLAIGSAWAAIDSTQLVADAGEQNDEQWQRRRYECDRKEDQSDGARQRRQDQPQASPRKSEKNSEPGRQRRERRPQPLPEQTAACAP